MNCKNSELTASNDFTKFKNEEVASNYGYLSGYKPKGTTEQTNRLRELFPGIGFADEKIAEGELPKHAEGWFTIPKWQTVAPTYGEAVEKVLAMIKNDRGGKFHNYREGQLGPDRLRQSAKSANVFEMLASEQKDHDILVVPAQFGIHRRGRSVRRAREVFASNESGLGAFATSIMLLTHPERLQHYDDLWIDCAGDEYAPGADGVFSHAPFFLFDDGQVKFDDDWVGTAYADGGSVSAFVLEK